ncbi:hypothetical protein IQ06DRAFT_291569 [Phaeosphaeriaceae sp. SRC1lsM3a]|nr:hypothetical protein IQ06DRAFT_291569 [Stagonospora sp. SRC1lsM3a]
MANTELIVPLVLAVLGLLSSAISLLYGRRNQKKADIEAGRLNERLEEFKSQVERKETVWTLTEKYGPPLLVAAYDLQSRLYELVEYPISRQHLTKPEGLEDLKVFSCYLLAQYLAYAHILRTKTGYLSFSFSDDERLKSIRKIMYMIDEELDRRRDANGQNVGVWPAARILVGERMMDKTSEVNAALDGGLGVQVKGWDQFRKEFDEGFREPMGYFCEWIDLMLEGRKINNWTWDAPLRVMQHLLVDLVEVLDEHRAYIFDEVDDLKCAPSQVDCDCFGTKCMDLEGKEAEEACKMKYTKLKDMRLKVRQDSRLYDDGLWAMNGRVSRGRGNHNYAANKKLDLADVKQMTHRVDLI